MYLLANVNVINFFENLDISGTKRNWCHFFINQISLENSPEKARGLIA